MNKVGRAKGSITSSLLSGKRVHLSAHKAEPENAQYILVVLPSPGADGNVQLGS